jgi:hypothetical protein
VQLDLSLIEQSDAASESSLLRDQGGLFRAAIGVTRIGPLPGDPGGTLDDSDLVPNPAFDGRSEIEFAQADGNGGGEIEDGVSITAITGLTPETVNAGTEAAFLGNVTLHAGETPGQTTTFELADNNPELDGTVTYDPVTGQVLDGQIASDTFTVTTVPEPTAATLFVLSSLMALPRRRRV